MLKISIIIPNYNNAKYLERCLLSVIRQTYKNIEIVCVDDKSTDNSLIILQKYQRLDKRIKVIALTKNKGVSNARNFALKTITGDFVCFLDSDDYLERTSCEYLLKSITAKKSDLACGGHVKVNSLNQHVGRWRPKKDISKKPTEEIYDFTKHRNVTQKLFKVSIIKENNIMFNQELTYREDAVFLMEYLKHCKIISGVKRILYNVQINFNSICRSEKLKARRESDSAKASEIIKKF